MDVEHVVDPIAWWYERRDTYPHLSRMALDYLTIPGESDFFFLLPIVQNFLRCLVATSVDVERLFSRGRLLLSHVHSHLTVQSTHALLCLHYWSRLNLIKTEDVVKVSSLPDVEGDKDKLEDGWDRIQVL